MDCKRYWALLALVGLGAGCGITPRRFQALADPAPLTRARAIGLGDKLPDEVVVPALIERLEDRDAVVRLSANESLKQRTGQDFGFVAWSDTTTRAQVVKRWRAWWQGRQAGLANSRRIP